MEGRNKIALIMPYFGKWPEWINLFFYSCGKNNFIDFYIFTDCPKPEKLPSNVIYYITSWKEHCSHISNALKIEFSSEHRPYKLCDLRPFYGLIYKELLKGYVFWGYGDIDLCYGNLRSWLNDSNLRKYDVLSTHANRLSGHFCLLRNNDKYNNAALEFNNWQKRIVDKKVYGLDEYDFTEYLISNIKWVHRLHRYIGRPFGIGHYKFFSMIIPFFIIGKRLHFKELHTSPAPKDGEEWKYYLQTGKVNSPKGKELPYIHFLFFKKTPFYKTNKYWREGFYRVPEDFFVHDSKCIIFTNKGIAQAK